MSDVVQTAQGILRVLVVEADDETRQRTSESLIRAGHAIETAATVVGAIDWAREEAFDVIFCDPRMPKHGGLDFVTWSLGYSPSTPLVVTAEDLDAGYRGRLADHPAVRFLDKPYAQEELLKTVDTVGPKRGFYGKAIEVELFDYVQMLALSGRDRSVDVATPRGRGRIWFEHGDIVHAEYRDQKGESAFYKLLSVGRGTFSETFAGEPPMRTVTRSSTHLLMEAARQTDEGTLGEDSVEIETEEAFFGNLLDDSSGTELSAESSLVEEIPDILEADPEPIAMPEISPRVPSAPIPIVTRENSRRMALRPMASDNEDEDFAALVSDAIEDQTIKEPLDPASSMAHGILRDDDLDPAESQAAMSLGGNAIFDDPDTRNGMLDQFWAFEGINGVAIISSTGKVLAEDMRSNSSLVTLAGFYMRGAARLARTLGYNVFDGVVACSVNGQQMVMVSMGAASAVLSVEAGADPEAVRDAVMGVE